MKLEEILKYAKKLGLSQQPTPWDEHYYIFWNVDWNEYPLYGSDCARWSFTEKEEEVEKIYLTIYDSKWGSPNTEIMEIKTLEELYETC